VLGRAGREALELAEDGRELRGGLPDVSGASAAALEVRTVLLDERRDLGHARGAVRLDARAGEFGVAHDLARLDLGGPLVADARGHVLPDAADAELDAPRLAAERLARPVVPVGLAVEPHLAASISCERVVLGARWGNRACAQSGSGSREHPVRPAGSHERPGGMPLMYRGADCWRGVSAGGPEHRQPSRARPPALVERSTPLVHELAQVVGMNADGPPDANHLERAVCHQRANRSHRHGERLRDFRDREEANLGGTRVRRRHDTLPRLAIPHRGARSWAALWVMFGAPALPTATRGRSRAAGWRPWEQSRTRRHSAFRRASSRACRGARRR